MHQSRDLRWRGCTFGMLRHRADHAELIRDLVKKPAAELDEIRLDLPRHAQHRGITGVGRRERGRGIEEPRPRHNHADADFAGRARVAIGHVCGGLLVAGVNDADARPAPRRARQMRHRAGLRVARKWYRRHWRSMKRPAPGRRSIPASMSRSPRCGLSVAFRSRVSITSRSFQKTASQDGSVRGTLPNSRIVVCRTCSDPASRPL